MRFALAIVLTFAWGNAVADGVLYKAYASVRRHLRDPQSARFRVIKRTPIAVCGFVNARNGFGGYAGESLFAYAIRQDVSVVLDDPTQGPLPGKVYEKLCK